MDSIRTTFFQGIQWNSGSQIYKQIWMTSIVIFLSRFLSPEDFGLVGITMVYLQFLNIFLTTGFESSIIQKEILSEIEISSIFWINTILGLLFFFVSALISPFISIFYNDSRLTLIIIVSSIIFIFNGFSVIQRGLLFKNFNFKKVSIIEAISITISGVIAGIAAINDLKYWSLVIQQICIVVFSSVGFWFISAWRPKLIIKFNSLKHLLSYNFHVTLFNIISYFSEQSDVLIIGKFFGSELLGYYVLANQIIFRPLNQIFLILRRTLFPILSSLQQKLSIFQETYNKSIHGLLAIIGPLLIAAYFSAPWFFPIIFGDKWMTTIPIFQVFSIRGLIYMLISPVGLIFFTIGAPEKYWRYFLFFVLPLNLAGILFGAVIRKNIIDVAIFLTLANFLNTYPLLKFSFSLIKLRVINFFSELKVVIFGLLLMTIFLISIFYLLGESLFFSTKIIIPTILFSFGIYFYLLYIRDKFIRNNFNKIIQMNIRGK